MTSLIDRMSSADAFNQQHVTFLQLGSGPRLEFASVVPADGKHREVQRLAQLAFSQGLPCQLGATGNDQLGDVLAQTIGLDSDRP